MARPVFHPSLEAAQHGPKRLAGFLDFAKKVGAVGAQPSNFMLEDGEGGFKSAGEIAEEFNKRELLFDGVSAHCPWWVHTTAWTGSPTIRPFIPAEVAQLSPDKIELWAEAYCLVLMDLCAELGIFVVPMFWGVAFGWEVATGYPWGLWKGPNYDLIQEGEERFVSKTKKLREHADSLGIRLCHEIHPGTAAQCASDFNRLAEICHEDPCLGIIADPSHCWEGESWEARFRKIEEHSGHPRVYACHIKNHTVRPGFPLRSMAPDWPARGMQFTDLATGDLNLTRFVEMLVDVGYPDNYRNTMNLPDEETVPLVVEAESAYRDLDATSDAGVAYVRDNLCFPIAEASFEDGMGADS